MRRVIVFGIVFLAMMFLCAPRIIAESEESMKPSTIGYEDGRKPLKVLADPSRMDIDIECVGSTTFDYANICRRYNLDFSADNTLWDMAGDEKQAQGIGEAAGFQSPPGFDFDNRLLIVYGRKVVSAEGILYEQYLHWDDAVALALTFEDDYERGSVYFYQIPSLRYLLRMTISPCYLMVEGERQYIGESVFDMNVLAEPPQEEIWN